MTKNTLSMIARLSGQSNYDIWSIRIEAVLTEKGLLSTIKPDTIVTEELDQKGLAMIRLSLDDGPLLQVRQCKTAAETWTSLKNLYSPKGFSSEFLICKELFETDLESCNHSMEDFLNTVKRLTDELKAKKIVLPDQVILAWVLNNLTSDYDAFTTIITQSLRTDSTGINLENLFSSLIDEARRQKSKDSNSTALLVNSKKRKFTPNHDPRKKARVICSHCKKPGHRQEKCWILHPDLKPKTPSAETSANHVAENSDEEYSTEAMHVNVFNTVDSKVTDFLLDSACSKHIICDKSYFSKFTEKATMVNWGNASKLRSNGYGDVRIRFSDTKKEATLHDCLFVPEFGVNLISMATLDQKGFSSRFQNGKFVLKKGNTHVTTGHSRNGLYYLPICPLAESVFLSNEGSDSDYSKWHLRMGHLGSNSMSHLSKCTKGVTITAKRKANDLDPLFCEVCQKAKFTSTVNRKSKFQAEYFLHKVYADLCGPITPESLGGGRYILLVLDSFTKWAEITILSRKSQTFEAFVKIKARLEKNAKNKLAIFKSDNGTEFKNKQFTELFDSTGITQQFTAPYAHEQNGQVERPNRTLLNKIRALLFSANAPKNLWAEAAHAAVYLYDRTPHSSRSFITPYQKRYNAVPDLSSVRIWGSVAYTKSYSAKKLDEKCNKCVLVNYGENQYKLLDPETHRTFWSRDVTVLEKPYFSDQEDKSSLIANDIDLEDLFSESVKPTSTQPSGANVQVRVPSYTPDETPSQNDRAGTYRYEGQTIDELSDDELAYHTGTLDEPKTYKDALQSPKWEEWKKAMEKELFDLDTQNTWSLVDLPRDKTPLKGRWVFKLKRNSTGDIEKYKARWVIKGFLQQPGIDFDETFCNTARPESWRVLLAEASKRDWEIHQIDVKSAFPNADIDKEIYTIQPTGFERGTKVCRLNKALYGLKQSARQWYKFLKDILNKFGLVHSNADEGIFYKKDLIIVCHIDDLLIISPKLSSVEDFKKHISKSVEITDLGEAHFFLGIQISRDRAKHTMTLSQKKYLMEILSKFNKSSVHPVSTPAELGIRLEKNQSTAEPSAVTEYQKQIGSLMYLMTKTRPDIAFAVNCCARFMSNPDATHFRALERIWKYLVGTVDFSLVYNSSELRPNLSGFVDSDWGGDYTTRKSTTGYLFYYANAPVSWSSRLQKTVALSSCEAEYMALKEAIKEFVWLQSLFEEIESLRTCNTKILLTDNQSAIDLSKNPEYHARSKHIDIQYHYVREITQSGQVTLKYVPTKENIADVFTKPLSPAVFAKFQNSLVQLKGD
jgi:transposase InsO family protein